MKAQTEMFGTQGGSGAALPEHHCHADGCNVQVPPEFFMCKPHWRLVPSDLRKRIWATYVPGQEKTKTPTSAYLAVARLAIEAVAKKEKRK